LSRTSLKKGSAELLILAIVAEQPRHGYEIGKLIERRSAGRIQFHISSLYPVLRSMQNRGWITGRWIEGSGRRRRHYQLTARGEHILNEQRAHWRAFADAVEQVIGAEHA
jgi:PadR family transcriptional regulator PadR